MLFLAEGVFLVKLRSQQTIILLVLFLSSITAAPTFTYALQKDLEPNSPYDESLKNNCAYTWGKNEAAQNAESKPLPNFTQLASTFNEINPNPEHALNEKILAAKFNEYKKRFNCKNVSVRVRDNNLPKPSIEGSIHQKSFLDELKKPISDLEQNYFNQIHESASGFIACNLHTPYITENRERTAKVLGMPCAEDFKNFFQDNEYQLTSDLKDTLEYKRFKKCVLYTLSLGIKIKSVNIRTSSSALRNTSGDYKGYHFNELTAKRAENIQKAIQDLLKNIHTESSEPKNSCLNNPSLLPQSAIALQEAARQAKEAEFSNVEYSLDVLGFNKDGTSGPCPYDIIDGKIGLKKEYLSSTGQPDSEKIKKEFDPYKQAGVSVSFEPGGKSQNEDALYYVKYPCKALMFSCDKQ